MHRLLSLLKQKRGAVRTLLLALLVLAAPTAHAQPTVDGRFDTQILNGAGAGGLDQFRVQLQLQPDQTFALGSATLMVLFNTNGLALPSNPAVNTELEAGTDYQFLPPFVSDPANGQFYLSSSVTRFGEPSRLSANLVLDLTGFGQDLPAGAFTPIVELYFDIVDAAQQSSLVWVLAPDPNPVEAFEADNATAVALGAFANDQTLLPVELIGFEAQVDGADVMLSWQTASETNNAGFEIQGISKNGGATHASPEKWQVLGFVEGHGTTLEGQVYRYRVAAVDPSRHVFRLKQIDFDGAFAYSPEVEVVVAMAEAYVLTAPYPNPFNPEARFSLMVKRGQAVEVSVFDVLGRKVAVLFAGEMAAESSRSVVLEGNDLASGLYVIRAVGEAFVATRRVLLLK